MTYEIRYIAGGREKLICFSDREETPELLCDATAESGVHRLILTPKTPVPLVSVMDRQPRAHDSRARGQSG